MISDIRGSAASAAFKNAFSSPLITVHRTVGVQIETRMVVK